MRTLQNRLDATIKAYRAEFAGKPRDTRDVDRLDELTREARGVLSSLERRIGPLRKDERALFADARKWIDVFVRERAAIVEQKSAPARTPERKLAAEPGGRTNLYLALLRSRHHPGAQRLDLALLYEVIEGLEQCERDMLEWTPDVRERWMTENIAGVQGSLAASRANETEIAKAMATGGVPERRGFLLQLGADIEHFLAWEEKFIRRGARRPARRRHAAATLTLLSNRIRMIGGLSGADADVVAGMFRRAEQLEAQEEAELKPEVVDSVVKELEAELASIAQVYKRDFANKLRTEVNLPLLRRVLHRASSVAIQATDLWKSVPNEQTEAFRFRTRERAFLYEDEERAVAEQQGKPGSR